MYGPPRVCKGIVKDGWTVCSNVSGLVIGRCGFRGQDGNPRVPVLINPAAFASH
jgi:hypothetical protein